MTGCWAFVVFTRTVGAFEFPIVVVTAEVFKVEVPPQAVVILVFVRAEACAIFNYSSCLLRFSTSRRCTQALRSAITSSVPCVLFEL